MPEEKPTYEELRVENQKLKNQLKSLQEKEDRSRIILNSIGDAVIMINANGLIRNMNPVAEQLTGWSEQKAKEKKLTEVIEIVNAQTAYALEGDKEKCLDAGCDEYVSKPVDKEKLQKMIGKFL